MSTWQRATLWAAVLLPLGIVFHEAAHFAGYVGYGFPDPTLSYASSGFAGMRDYWIVLREGDRAAADAVAPISNVGMAALFGPLLTLLIGSFGLFLLHRFNSIFGGALAFTAFFRAIPVTLAYVLGRPEHTDESHVTLTLGIPDLPFVLTQLAGLLWSGWLVQYSFGWKTFTAMLTATIASLAIWMTALGPLLLPE